MGLDYSHVSWGRFVHVDMVCEGDMMFKWIKKWCWDIWFDEKPNNNSTHLTHEERIELLKEKVKR